MVLEAEAVSYSIVFIVITFDGFHAIVWVHELINPFQEDPRKEPIF